MSDSESDIRRLPDALETDGGDDPGQAVERLETRRLEQNLESQKIEIDMQRQRLGFQKTVFGLAFWFAILAVAFVVYSLGFIVPEDGIGDIVKVSSIVAPVAAATAIAISLPIGVFRGFRGRDGEKLPAEAIVDTIVRRAANRDS